MSSERLEKYFDTLATDLNKRIKELEQKLSDKEYDIEKLAVKYVQMALFEKVALKVEALEKKVGGNFESITNLNEDDSRMDKEIAELRTLARAMCEANADMEAKHYKELKEASSASHTERPMKQGVSYGFTDEFIEGYEEDEHPQIKKLREAVGKTQREDAGSARLTELKEQIPIIEYHYKYPNKRGGITYEVKYYDPKDWKLVEREDLELIKYNNRNPKDFRIEEIIEKYLAEEEHDV